MQRDWSHMLKTSVKGYLLMAEKGAPGRVYVQGSGEARSVGEFMSLQHYNYIPKEPDTIIDVQHALQRYHIYVPILRV